MFLVKLIHICWSYNWCLVSLCLQLFTGQKVPKTNYVCLDFVFCTKKGRQLSSAIDLEQNATMCLWFWFFLLGFFHCSMMVSHTVTNRATQFCSDPKVCWEGCFYRRKQVRTQAGKLFDWWANIGSKTWPNSNIFSSVMGWIIKFFQFEYGHRPAFASAWVRGGFIWRPEMWDKGCVPHEGCMTASFEVRLLFLKGTSWGVAPTSATMGQCSLRHGSWLLVCRSPGITVLLLVNPSNFVTDNL